MLATGFRGWLSVEVFDGRFNEKYGEDLANYARKAKEAVDRMMEEADVKSITSGQA